MGTPAQAIAVGELDRTVLRARGSEAEINALIRTHDAFIRSRLMRYAQAEARNHYDDLYSISLMAFYEAIKTYDTEKGNFFPFADMVIRRRLIDNFRKKLRTEEALIILDDPKETLKPQSAVLDASMTNYRREGVNRALVLEIEQFTKELAEMGISFESLEAHSPKHTALRREYRYMLRMIVDHAEIRTAIFKKKYFPAKKIHEISGMPIKKVERARIFIMAAMVILKGDYIFLSDYMPLTDEIEIVE